MIEIHRDQIGRSGGSHGLRDLASLQSAVAMPQASFGGRSLHGDLLEIAAALFFHIAPNHPSVDGNGRVGTASAPAFLAISGIEVRATNDALVETVLGVAQGKIGKAAIAEFLRKHSRR